MTSFLLALYLLGAWTALLTGQADAAAQSLFCGAEDAVRFCLSLAGGLCFWSALLELYARCGLTRRLSLRLRPLLRRLFPRSCEEAPILDALAENLTANLLGLGNAATPAGIRAVGGMARLGAPARDELCLLVVFNTASLQLLPATIAALRASAGAASPFDILPAVWFSTACSLAAGLAAAALLRRLYP